MDAGHGCFDGTVGGQKSFLQLRLNSALYFRQSLMLLVQLLCQVWFSKQKGSHWSSILALNSSAQFSGLALVRYKIETDNAQSLLCFPTAAWQRKVQLQERLICQ